MEPDYKAAADALAGGVGPVPEIWTPDGSKKIETREEFLQYYPGYKEFFERIDQGVNPAEAMYGIKKE